MNPSTSQAARPTNNPSTSGAAANSGVIARGRSVLVSGSSVDAAKACEWSIRKICSPLTRQRTSEGSRPRLPIRASKGFALRYFADRWDIPLEHVLAAGGSGADEDMMRGNTMAVVVANRHHEELSALIDMEHIYFAEQPFAAGILEALEHYAFFRDCGVKSA